MSALFFSLRSPCFLSSVEVWSNRLNNSTYKWLSHSIGSSQTWDTHFISNSSTAFTTFPINESDSHSDNPMQLPNSSKVFLYSEKSMGVSNFLHGLSNSTTIPSKVPAFRCSLMISSPNSPGWKMSQGEYPLPMTFSTGSLISYVPPRPPGCVNVHCYLVNILREPLFSEASVTLVSRKSNNMRKITSFRAFTNYISFLDLSPFASEEYPLVLLSPHMRAIPYFVWTFPNGEICFEHTHSPDHFLLGDRKGVISSVKDDWFSHFKL